MADTQQYNVNILVSDNGTSDNVKKSIKDLNTTIKDLSTQSVASTSSAGSFAEALSHISINTVGARRELIVLAHELAQGNYSRFGQSLMVMAERMDALALIFSPVGVGIAAVAAGFGLLAVAAVKGAEEQNKYNAEIALTGNFAGTTSGNLRQMSLSIGEATNNFSGAKEAVNKLTESGRFTVDQIDSIGKSISEVSKVTGVSVDKMVSDYVKLAASPTRAAVELNKQFHFLTVALYDQIAALEKQGKTSEAAAIAIDALTRHQDEATKQVQSNLGTLAQAAKDSATWFHKWWDEVLGIGRKPDATSAVEDINKQIDFAQQQVKLAQWKGLSGQAEQNHVDALIKERDALMVVKAQVDANAAAQGKLTQEQQKAVDGENYLNTHSAEYTSKITQRKDELNKLVQAAKDAGKSQADINKIISGFNANHVDTAGNKLVNDDLSTQIEKIRGNIEAERIALRAALDDAKTEYNSGATSYKQYIDKKEALETAELQQELAYTKQMEALSKDKIAKGGVEGQKFVNQEADLNERIKAVHNKSLEELSAYNKRSEELIANVLKTAGQFNQNNDAQNLKTLDPYLMTDDMQKFAEQRRRILDEYVNLQQQLNLDYKQGKISLEDYNKAQDELDKKREDALETMLNTQKTELKFQHDFGAGWRQAFRQYTEDSENSFKKGQEAFQAMTSDMETALENFATTGKLSFSELARSILADLAKIAAKTAASGIMKLIGGAVFGTGGGAMAGTTMAGDVLTAAANGMVVQNGLKKFASGGVVSSPTMFPMANGAGLMGEAGPEAIMPLTRDSSGRLGVTTSGSGSGLNIGSIVINVKGGNTNEETAAAIKKEMLTTMKQIADGRIQNARRPGGLLNA